jgi:hypothetical protein
MYTEMTEFYSIQNIPGSENSWQVSDIRPVLRDKNRKLFFPLSTDTHPADSVPLFSFLFRELRVKHSYINN